MNEKNLEVKIVLVSKDAFDLEIYEPESGEFKRIKCHDSGPTCETENQEIIEEIRSWVSITREVQE